MTLPARYNRQINLQGFGKEAQQKLLQATILVVGAGGLGLPALQYLAAMGAGTLGIVDGDMIDAANLNRQILYYESEIGLSKAKVAGDKLMLQNPGIRIRIFDEFLTVTNAIDIVSQFDLVIDATDNFSVRYLINDTCVITKTPFIYGAIQGYEGHVSVFNYQGGPTYRCLYPQAPGAGESPDCNTNGVLGVVPGIIGCQQALEAIKVITGIGKTASGVLRIFDFLNNEQYEINLRVKPVNTQIQLLQDSYEVHSCVAIPWLEVDELYRWLDSEKKFLLLDVREKHEYEQARLERSQLLPLSDFNCKELQSPVEIPVVTLCQKGSRSITAATLLRENNKDLPVYWLKGGMEQWQKEYGNKMIVS